MSLWLTYILKQAFLPVDNIQKIHIFLYGALHDNSQLNALYIFFIKTLQYQTKPEPEMIR